MENTIFLSQFSEHVFIPEPDEVEAIWRQELFRDNSGQGYGNKLRTYRLFKNTFNFEHYLSFGNYSQ